MASLNSPNNSIAPYISGSKFSSLARVAFRVQSAGAATTAPDFVIPAGACTTPTHATTGVYTVVIADYLRLGTFVSGSANVLGTVSSNATGIHIYIVSYVASTGVLTFHAYTRGTEATAPALAIVPDNDWVCFDLVFAQDVASEGTATALA